MGGGDREGKLKNFYTIFNLSVVEFSKSKELEEEKVCVKYCFIR